MKKVHENPITKNRNLPWHSWLFGGILFLYGLAAAYDYLMSLSQGEVYYRASGMTESQVSYFLAVPLWAVIGWTLSVWCGLFASTALLFHHRFSINLFLASLAGSLIYIFHVLVLSAGREAMGAVWFMPLVIAAITAAMVFYCWRLGKCGVLR